MSLLGKHPGTRMRHAVETNSLDFVCRSPCTFTAPKEAYTISLMSRSRKFWLILGLTLLTVCIALGVRLGWSAAGIIFAAAVIPDVALIGAFASAGRLRPERVRFYNLLHAPALAVTTTITGALVFLTTHENTALLIGFAWLTHIAVDRACGFGLREADGSIRPVGLPRRVRA